MKYFIASICIGGVLISPLFAGRAEALSCLPVDMYLKDVIGNEEVLIFTATSKHREDAANYTREVLEVEEAKQGYLEEEIFVYHEKNKDWGYLCNSGPKGKGSTGVYVATRDGNGQYNVHQRLELTDPLVNTIDADLESKKIEGGLSPLSRTDHMNQIMTTILELLRKIGVLFKEHAYLKAHS